MRVSGVRKSCATLSLTCLTSPINVSMRSSIKLRFSATRSHSSWLPRSGMRLSRPLCIMARLVALICSIRPTVRRVTRMLASPATTTNNAPTEITAVLICSVKLSSSPISLPTNRPKVAIAISASLNVDDVKVLARSTETVPDTANCMDQRIGLVVVEFAAHAPDIDVDDIRRRIEMKIPDVLQQHGAGNDAALVACQILQKLEFPRKKKDGLAAPARGSRHQVDREIADTQDGLLDNGFTAP